LNNRLYICENDFSPYDTSSLIYQKGISDSHLPNDKIINDAVRFNEIALEIKNDYNNFIFSIRDLFAEHNLLHDNLNLYFISDVSNRRTDLFETFNDICHLELLKELVTKKNIKEAVLCGCSSNFEKAFISFFTDIKINFISSYKNREIDFYAQHKKFFIKAFLYRLRTGKTKCPKPDNTGKIFFSRYPNRLKKGMYDIKYGNLVDSDSCFLATVLTDGMHQSYSLKSYINFANELNSQKEPFLFLDNNLKLADIINAYSKGKKLFKKAEKLIKHNYIFNQFDISGYLNHELTHSFLRIPRLLMYKNAFLKIFKENDINYFYFNLFEFSYGKYFNHILAEYFPSVKRIGVQHGPPSKRTIGYSLAENELGNSMDGRSQLTPTDEVLCENEYSASIYAEAGHKNIKIMDEIYRLDYLKTIKRENIQKNTVLIACALHDAESIYRSLREEVANNKDKTYYFKLHPSSKNDNLVNKIKSGEISNLKLAEKNISEYLDFVQEVICTSSSVGVEAYDLGIKVRVLLTNDMISNSPLLDYEKNDLVSIESI